MNIDEFMKFDKHCRVLQVTTLTEKSGRTQKVPKMWAKGQEAKAYEKYPELSIGTRKVSRCGKQHTTKGRKTAMSLLPSLFMPES